MKRSAVERRMLVQGDFNNDKDYIDYTINLVLENELEFKCFRRYRFFDMFNICLMKKYPFYAIPKLPEKKVKNLLLNTADREKKLNFYLNYLYNHPELKNTDEFLEFVGEFSFVSLNINTLLPLLHIKPQLKLSNL